MKPTYKRGDIVNTIILFAGNSAIKKQSGIILEFIGMTQVFRQFYLVLCNNQRLFIEQLPHDESGELYILSPRYKTAEDIKKDFSRSWLTT